MIKIQILKYIANNRINLYELAKKINIPVENLTAILNEKTVIDAEMYFIICKALGVPLNKFI